MKVVDIRARKILATNAEPTIEIELETQDGKVMASAPMGTSRGRYEALQISADDGVRKFDMMKRLFKMTDFHNQYDIDKAIKTVDQTSNFREIGGNLAIAISSAFLKAFALEEGKEVWKYVADEYGTKPRIPFPLCNVVGGWKGQSDFQEYLFLPVHQKYFSDSLFKMSEAYKLVGQNLAKRDRNFNFGKNLESAWVTSLEIESILEVMRGVADEMLLKIGIDVAASQFYKENLYHYRGGMAMNPHEHFDFLSSLVRKYPISYIEDPFQEDDWLSFSTSVHRWQPRIVCGDDFYATRIHRLLSSVDKKASNATIVKPNQIGTITDAIEFAKEARSRGLVTVMSHRSGETEDTLISHLAVGLGCDYVKFGIAGERAAKLNEILRIEDTILDSMA